MKRRRTAGESLLSVSCLYILSVHTRVVAGTVRDHQQSGGGVVECR
jgi:hypothetical protein